MPIKKKKKRSSASGSSGSGSGVGLGSASTIGRSSRKQAGQPAGGKNSRRVIGEGKSKSSIKAEKFNNYRTRSGKVSLDPLREELEVLVTQANLRASELIASGLPSRALMEAQRTLARQSTRDQDILFRSDLKTRKQINREFARVHEFLNDYTSTLRGANDFKSDFDRFSGNWGDTWVEAGMDPEKRMRTFDLYRRVVEAAGGWERAIGILKGKESLTGYGSENLVNNIYDMIENNFSDGDIIAIALEQINAGIAAYEEMAKRQKADYDYGIVFDDETTTARRDFYTWRRRYRKEYDL